MAIVQISRITNRKGLQENLPQLSGAELGWSIDERRLFIGNGTLQEGAPVIGNTEVLTEFSDIFAFQTNYTYKGEAAGYEVQTGPTPSTPITQSLQSWLDQFATVKDFGATGDGVTDDTAAINRALYQLYCRESNPQIRRSLFFPSGVYRVTETILIPPYATLWGEGIDNSVIRLDSSTDDSTLNAFVARTADSLQQTGNNIGTNGATPPQFITISNLGFQNLDPTTNVFLVEDASNCKFQSVGFLGPLTESDLNTDSDDTAGIRFASTASLITNQIVFDGCRFGGTTYGVNTATELGGTDQQISGVIIQNGEFNTLYQGVVMGTEPPVSGGATGVRILGNLFDNIYAEGIIIGAVSLNATGHNIFYLVGNGVTIGLTSSFGVTTAPYTAIIEIQSNNNVSISDLFQRADAQSIGTPTPGTTYPRVLLNNTTSIATVNSNELALGTFVRKSGLVATLVNNTVSATTIFTFNTAEICSFSIDYTIRRATTYRHGTLNIVAAGGGVLTYTDDFNENISTGITLSVTQSLDTISVKYTSTSTGNNAQMTYSVTHLG